MEVNFTAEQEAFIRQAVASGRYRSPEEAVQEALARWQTSERSRLELLSALDEAEADLDAGRFTDYSNATLSDLATELKREARAQRQQP
jgi:putative addiction module CopG family antidote